ncbi:MAG: PEP-CTERM sorting domain-containing protein [Rubripirellula sp.]
MFRPRIHVLTCLAAATLLVFQATAVGGIIAIDTDTDGLTAPNTRNEQFSWRDGYVKLFGFNELSGNLATLKITLAFQQTGPTGSTAFANDFSVVFFDSNVGTSLAVAQVGLASVTGATASGDNSLRTIDGVSLDATAPATWNAADGIGRATNYQLLQWIGGNSGATAVTTEWDLADTTLAGISLENLSAYYFNGYTQNRGPGTANPADTRIPAGDWVGDFDYTLAAATTQAVPEPSTATMAALGLLTLLGGNRRRRR